MVSMPLSGISPIVNLSIVPTIITSENSVIITQEELSRIKKANSINSFFTKNDAPLAGYGMKFVIEAEKNDIDWRLLSAIGMRETTGGKHSCKNPIAPNNNFGWFSCKKGFDSVDSSIEYISKMIGGDSKYYHEHMTSEEILKKYNPDYIIPGYSKQVIRIMKMIDKDEAIM